MVDVEGEGENKEFAIALISDVTIYVNDSTNTSANDTAIKKYFDNQLPNPFASAKKFALRSDNTVQIVSINNVTFTDPYTAIVDKGISETFDVPTVWKMVIRTTAVNTAVKLRIK